MSSEYDLKMQDTVVLFGSNEKGIPGELKEKYKLGTQCVLYVYVPGAKELVRVIVEASALSGDKNPNGEMGLFECYDSFKLADGELLLDYLTEFGSVYREDTQNKRKSYWAMTFARKKIEPENREKMIEMLKDIREDRQAIRGDLCRARGRWGIDHEGEIRLTTSTLTIFRSNIAPR